MKERTAWPSILAVALLLRWVEPAPCAGQSPAPTPANPTPPAQRAASPASPLASAVSSDIERFVKRSGRDLPPPPPLTAVNARQSQGAGALLMQAAEAWSRKKKCVNMSVRSNGIRERAHKFYERQGYVHYKTQKAFRKPL